MLPYQRLSFKARSFFLASNILGFDKVQQVPLKFSRKAYENLIHSLDYCNHDVQFYDTQVLSGRHGSIPVRLYQSEGSADIMIYFHGGGWTIGSIETHHNLCKKLSYYLGCTVISVGYRLAPEFPFPAAIQDAEAVYQWVLETKLIRSSDSPRISLAGDSAGGNLAMVLAARCVDQNLQRPYFMLLLYPTLDLQFNQDSLKTYGKGYFLTHDALRLYRKNYLPQDLDPTQWEVSPLFYNRMQALPPSIIVTADHDPVQDDGRALYHKIQLCGGKAYHLNVQGTLHGFMQLESVFQPEIKRTFGWIKARILELTP